MNEPATELPWEKMLGAKPAHEPLPEDHEYAVSVAEMVGICAHSDGRLDAMTKLRDKYEAYILTLRK